MLVLQIISQMWTIWYWSWWFGFRLEPISTTAPVASNMTIIAEATQKYSFRFISLNPWHDTLYLSETSFIKYVDSTSLNFFFVIATAKITIGLSGYGRTQLRLGVRTGLSPKQSTPTTLEQVSSNASILWHFWRTVIHIYSFWTFWSFYIFETLLIRGIKTFQTSSHSAPTKSASLKFWLFRNLLKVQRQDRGRGQRLLSHGQALPHPLLQVLQLPMPLTRETFLCTWRKGKKPRCYYLFING